VLAFGENLVSIGWRFKYFLMVLYW